MSLFGSLQMAGNTLQAMQIGLHVVGNNIANANTPGYVREKAVFSPAPVQKLGNLTIGLGVEVTGIVQIIDKFVESRLRDAGGDRASAEVQENVYRELEGVLASLQEKGSITTLITDFFNAVNEVTNAPENIAIRDLAIAAGGLLTQSIATLEHRVAAKFQDLDTRVTQVADEINTLSEEIRQLNLRIVTLEGGGASGSEVGGLRSQRGVALKKLAELADITVNESDTGVTNVNINGEILIFEGTRREVVVDQADGDGRLASQIRFADNGSPLEVSGGELQGLYEARDTILGGFLDGLDDFAQALTFEFNKVYSQGQGAVGFDTLTSTYRAVDPAAALNNASLEFTPINGKFDLIIHNKNSKNTENNDTSTITIDLNGTDSETTLISLAEAIDAVSGVSAVVSLDNELVITSDSADIEFAFEKDTSGVLAALGLNTFFTGSSAATLGVNQVLVTGESAGSRFAASLTGIGVGTDNAIDLIELQDKGLEGIDGSTILGVYDRLINETTQGATISASVAEGLRVFESTLDASAQAVTGVNLDEEAIDMIQLQRAYQASARYIRTLSELLDVLVNL